MEPFWNKKLADAPIANKFVDTFRFCFNLRVARAAKNCEIIAPALASTFGWDDVVHNEIAPASTPSADPAFAKLLRELLPVIVIGTIRAHRLSVLPQDVS